MKKARKGMLLSLLSLVFALAITATSTYAWFMVNTSVTASNMQVRVKSDTTYLVISATDTLGTDTELDEFTPGNAILPAMYDQAANSTAAGTWKKARGTEYDDGAQSGGYTAIDSTDLTAQKYYKKYTFYVGLTATTALPAQNLRVSAISAEVVSGSANTFLPAVSAVVNYDNVWLDFADINASGTQSGIGSMDPLLGTVAINMPYQIDVYLYINGDNAVVTSENALPANLGSFNVSITLSVTPGSEA